MRFGIPQPALHPARTYLGRFGHSCATAAGQAADSWVVSGRGWPACRYGQRVAASGDLRIARAQTTARHAGRWARVRVCLSSATKEAKPLSLGRVAGESRRAKRGTGPPSHHVCELKCGGSALMRLGEPSHRCLQVPFLHRNRHVCDSPSFVAQRLSLADLEPAPR